MKITIILTCIALAGCIPEVPDVPTQMRCTGDGWQYNPETNEVTQGEDGAAMLCDLS